MNETIITSAISSVSTIAVIWFILKRFVKEHDDYRSEIKELTKDNILINASLKAAWKKIDKGSCDG